MQKQCSEIKMYTVLPTHVVPVKII